MYPSLPPKVQLPFLVVSFVSRDAPNKWEKVIKEPWFALVRSQTNAKDAADHVLTIAASIAHFFADLNSNIFLVCMDGGAREVVSTLERIKVQDGVRKIVLLSPDHFKETIASLNPGMTLDEIRTHASPALMQKKETHTPPVKPPEDNPMRYHICDICGKFGKTVEEIHYIWRCPDLQNPDKVSKFSVDDEDGKTEKLKSPQAILEEWENRFQLFLEIIYKTYIVNGEMRVNVATLGRIMKGQVYVYKCSLSHFIERAVELGLMKREAMGGRVEVVFSNDDFINWNSKRTNPL
jgi:hypothetical protein